MNLKELENELLSKIRGKSLSEKQDLDFKLKEAKKKLNDLKANPNKTSEELSEENKLETEIREIKKKLDDSESEAKAKAILAINRIEQLEDTTGDGKGKIRAIDVKNPLSMIALFVTILELAAFIVLPQLLKAEVTGVPFFHLPIGRFIYFLILFPVFVVSLFFYLLWFKPHNLYSPSDFKDEDHFMELNKMKKEIRVLKRELKTSSKSNVEANLLIAGILGTDTPESLIDSTKESIRGPSTGDNILLEEVKNIYHK